MGVSATHLDWSMVPYVRKSFVKHFKDGLKYIEEKIDYDFESLNNQSIDNKELKEKHPKAYQYAIDKTTKETYQAVEGMYHNLSNWAA